MGNFVVDSLGLSDVLKMDKRQLLYQILNFGMIVSTALMIWKGLIVMTNSESPIVVVLSGSMEPAFYRGDLLFLTNHRDEPIRVGDIVVFKIEGREIPIVHRVLNLHEKEDGSIKVLTKGDNNRDHDRGLYAPGQLWLQHKDIVGRAKGLAYFCYAVFVSSQFAWDVFLVTKHWSLLAPVLRLNLVHLKKRFNFLWAIASRQSVVRLGVGSDIGRRYWPTNDGNDAPEDNEEVVVVVREDITDHLIPK
ncbi:unnamed protein product, partial [Oppiella nova]